MWQDWLVVVLTTVVVYVFENVRKKKGK